MEQLMGLRRADAAIVGGGLTGLLLGSALSQVGMRVAVVDAGGFERPTVAVATVERLSAMHGLESARQYAAGLQAQLHTLTAAPLPYVRQTAVYTYARTQADLPALEARHALLTALHLPVHVAPDAGGCPFPVELSLSAQGQALVDMPRWTTALQRNIRRAGGRLYTDSRVVSIDGPRVCTERGCVHAPLIILAAGKPPGLRHKPLLALLESRVRAHCLLTADEPLHHVQRCVDPGGLSLCPAALGAYAAWDLGCAGTHPQKRRLADFEHTLRARLPDDHPGDIFFTQDVFSLDGLPVIGALPDSRVLCATGFGEVGILGAMHAASVLSRRILGRALPEDAAYAPDRAVPWGVRRRAVAQYAGNLLRRSAPACPHCGCRLRYSPTHRWECPYCGSVYAMLGQVICGPGVRPAHVSARQLPLD